MQNMIKCGLVALLSVVMSVAYAADPNKLSLKIDQKVINTKDVITHHVKSTVHKIDGKSVNNMPKSSRVTHVVCPPVTLKSGDKHVVTLTVKNKSNNGKDFSYHAALQGGAKPVSTKVTQIATKGLKDKPTVVALTTGCVHAKISTHFK